MPCCEELRWILYKIGLVPAIWKEVCGIEARKWL
jgi:hypothetical protein